MLNKELIKLIKEYQNHQMENFSLIYDTFYKLITMYAIKIGDKEAVQDLSGFLVELLFKIDISKFKEDDSEDIKKYIAVCLRNEYYAMLRQKAQPVFYSDELINLTSNITYNYEDTLLVQECLGIVTEYQRKILILRYCYDLSDSQIAEKLHISRQAVSKARKKGLETLKNFLSQ